MFPLAHLGIGSLIGRPFAKKSTFCWLLLGTMLPDLIDKPAFFILGTISYLSGGEWVPGKRGIAHTLIFLLLVIVLAAVRRSASWAACACGISTHLLLDTISKLVGTHQGAIADNLTVLFWPLLGWDFPTMAYGLHGIWTILLEGLGGGLLIWQLIRFRREI